MAYTEFNLECPCSDGQLLFKQNLTFWKSLFYHHKTFDCLRDMFRHCSTIKEISVSHNNLMSSSDSLTYVYLMIRCKSYFGEDEYYKVKMYNYEYIRLKRHVALLCDRQRQEERVQQNFNTLMSMLAQEALDILRPLPLHYRKTIKITHQKICWKKYGF